MTFRPLVASVVCLLSSACWVPIEQGQAMESDIVKMKAELMEQRRLTDESTAGMERERALIVKEQTATLARVDSKIAEVTAAIDKLNHAARKTGADLGVELSDALVEIARLRGLIEEVQVKQESLDETAQALRGDLDARLAELDGKVKNPSGSVKIVVPLPSTPTETASVRSKDDVYNLAREKLEKKEHDEAGKLFAEFLAKWPKDSLASNSQYWLGESYYAQKKYREAILEFRKVSEKYPESDKTPDALLKIGYSFAALGLKDEARLFLDEVIRTHPKSAAAKLAKSKAAELK